MADYAGAVAAMRERFAANWTETPVAYQNEEFSSPIDPTNGNRLPWVFFEVIGNESGLRGAGVPGDHVWLTTGHILVHVFVPTDSGIAEAHRLAVAAGEIFRAQGFYSADPGTVVRTWAPQTDGGGTDADDGNWFRVTCTIPFEFFFRG